MPYVPIPWASHAPPCWLRLVPHRRHAASTRSAHGSQFARKRILIGGTGQCDGAFHLRDGRFEVTRCYRIQLCDGPVHTSRRHPITVRLVNADGVLVLLDALEEIPLGNVHITERDKKAGLVRIVATFPDPREHLVFIVIEGCDQGAPLGMLYGRAWELLDELHPTGPATKRQQLPIRVRELHRFLIGPILQDQRGCFLPIIYHIGDAGPIGVAVVQEKGGDTTLAEGSASTAVFVRTQPRCHHDLHSPAPLLDNSSLVSEVFPTCGGR